ncbi:TrkA family potassium uptake protein [Microlunatus elymi]|uniref:TrkA family potassium uptake protein n=1 Tax=Microlunatus elymi TaxID=2596828 RepID=A0A516PUM3_9ACTN|nr:TrkA family potassium uptake protein [Microlunatus elymi]QDP94849.1 TrkA family potassium uptake protein [Microlunatus elymi]
MFGSGSNGRKQDHDGSRQVAVIGLGRFGSSLALELAAKGVEVLGIDSDHRLVQRYAEELTETAVADSTDPEALQQLGLPDFERVVVGIGTHLEASILTTSVLVDFQIPYIWAKAVTRQHARILERIGAHHVVSPEYDMGERVAHLVVGRMLDYIQLDHDFALIKTVVPGWLQDRPFAETRPRSRYGVTVVGLKRSGEDFSYATEQTTPRRGDVMIVSGTVDAVERFANDA